MIDSRSTTVYASLQDSNELLAIDLATQQPRWKIAVGKMPADLFLSGDDRTLLVALTGDEFVEAYDVSGDRAAAASGSRTGAGAHAFRARGDGRHVLVSNRVANTHQPASTCSTLEVVETLSRARRAGLHGDARRRQDAADDLALGAQAHRHRHGEEGSRAAGRGRPFAARRLDARPCAAPLRLAAALVRGPPGAGAAAAAPPAAPRPRAQAGLPHLRHRPHGRRTADRRGARSGRQVQAPPSSSPTSRHASGGGSLDAAMGRRSGRRARRKATRSASHTLTTSTGRPTQPRRLSRASRSAGAEAGKDRHWTAAAVLRRNRARRRPLRRTMTGAPMLDRICRAPGGKTSPALLAAARLRLARMSAGRPAGFLGDELPSERIRNALLLERALRDIRHGDILLAHLGIWSRKDPWAPAVLEPLIAGLKARGLLLRDPARASSVPRVLALIHWLTRHARPDPAPLTSAFGAAQQWLFEGAGAAAGLFTSAWRNLLEDAFVGTGWLLVGLIQIAVIWSCSAPLERWRPVEPVTDRARRPHRHRSTRCCTASACSGWRSSSASTRSWTSLFGELRLHGVPTWHLDQPGRLVAGRDRHAAGRASSLYLVVLRLRRLLAPPRPARPATGGGACIRCTTASAR